MERHIAVIGISAFGHVTPTLPLVAELVRRGWRVSYAASPRFAAAVGKAGATLVPTTVPPTTDPGLTGDGPRVIAGLLRRLVVDARTNTPALLARFRDDPPEAVCFDALSLSGRVLAHALDAADVALLPSLAIDEHSTPFVRPGDRGSVPPELAAAARDRAQFLAEYGLAPPSRAGMGDPASLNVVFVPREFQPGADAFDDRFRFVGPSLAGREDAPGWTTPPDPVVLVSLGTAFTDRPTFFRTCLDALAGAGPVAMAVGEHVDVASLGPVPANIDVRRWLPQPAVLRHARAFVSHAGMGSVMEALHYGVPLVCVPQMIEQEVNADRVAELGLGVTLDPADVTAAGLRAAVETVATSDTVRRALDAMRSAVARAGGATAAADAVEAHLALAAG